MKKLKRVLLLTGDYPFSLEGDAIFIKNEIESIINCFDQVSIISTSDKKNPSYDSRVNAIQIPLNKIKFFPLLKSFMSLFTMRTFKEVKFAVKKLKQKFGFNMIKQIFKYYYAYYMMKKNIITNIDEDTVVYSFWLSSRAYAVSRLKKKYNMPKVISRVHGFDCYLTRGYLPFRQELVRDLDEISFISNQGLNYFKDNILIYCKEKHAKLKVSRLGLNIAGMRGVAKNNEKLKIVSCSNIIALKRLDIIIDSLSLVRDIDVEWTHYGDGPLRQNIEMQCKQNLPSNVSVSFLGWCSSEMIYEKYMNGEYDIFINTSDSEGIPVSIMEAYAFGIPAITRDVGGISEINNDAAGTYLLAADAGPEQIASAIRGYYHLSIEEKQRKKDEVYAKFVQCYSVNNYKIFSMDLAENKKDKLILTAFQSQLSYANINTDCSFESYTILPIYKELSSLFLKLIRRLWFAFKLPYSRIWYSDILKNNCYCYTEIIVFDSLFGYDIFNYLHKHSKGKVFLWFWNIFKGNPKKLKKIRNVASVYSFDQGDCDKYQFNFNHQFYGNMYQGDDEVCKKGLLFVGRNKNRIQMLYTLRAELAERGIMCDFYIQTKDIPSVIETGLTISKRFLPYEEVMAKIAECSCILDLVQDGQVGITLRSLEAVFNNKKIITNNKSISSEIFYNTENILIIDNNITPDEIAQFLNKDMVSYSDIDKYSFVDWLENFQ